MKKAKIKKGDTELEISVYIVEPWELQEGFCRVHFTFTVTAKNPLKAEPFKAMDFEAYEPSGSYKQQCHLCCLKIRRILAAYGAKETDMRRVLDKLF